MLFPRPQSSLLICTGLIWSTLPVDKFGLVDPDQVRQRIRKTTAVVSVIYANNEIGSINPISEIGEICRLAAVPFHTDAVQATAYLPVDAQELNVDLLALGAHKFYGPKGIGALFIRSGASILPSQTGGGQEFGLRAGTHNIAFIWGMAKAFELATKERQDRIRQIQPLRDFVIGRVLESVPDSMLTGHPENRLPNHASFVFKGVDGNALLMMLDIQGYACSSGSACKTGDPEPSEVLSALGFPREWALGSLRITLGTGTTPEQLEQFTTILPGLIEKARSLNKIGN
jgi:cysteine desulfurase